MERLNKSCNVRLLSIRTATNAKQFTDAFNKNITVYKNITACRTHVWSTRNTVHRPIVCAVNERQAHHCCIQAHHRPSSSSSSWNWLTCTYVHHTHSTSKTQMSSESSSSAAAKPAAKVGKKCADNTATQREFTKDEIATHNSDSDCWMIIHGKVGPIIHAPQFSAPCCVCHYPLSLSCTSTHTSTPLNCVPRMHVCSSCGSFLICCVCLSIRVFLLGVWGDIILGASSWWTWNSGATRRYIYTSSLLPLAHMLHILARSQTRSFMSVIPSTMHLSAHTAVTHVSSNCMVMLVDIRIDSHSACLRPLHSFPPLFSTLPTNTTQ